MSLYSINTISVENLHISNNITNSDTSKQFNFDSSQLADNEPTSYILPHTDTVLIGNNTVDELTNKTITDPTNNVAASLLRTNSSPVSVVSSPPQSGYILSATNSTTAGWRNINNVYFSNPASTGTVNTGCLDVINWYGKTTTDGGIATFHLTTNGLSNGPAIFGSINDAFFSATARIDTSSDTGAPFASIRRIQGNSVEVNVRVGVSGVLGINKSAQSAPNGTQVYLHAIGS